MAATVKESVKETLLGHDEEGSPASNQTQAAFDKFAIKDETTGEYFMGKQEFINAVAPESEDYVSSTPERRVHLTTRDG